MHISRGIWLCRQCLIEILSGWFGKLVTHPGHGQPSLAFLNVCYLFFHSFYKCLQIPFQWYFFEILRYRSKYRMDFFNPFGYINQPGMDIGIQCFNHDDMYWICSDPFAQGRDFAINLSKHSTNFLYYLPILQLENRYSGSHFLQYCLL